MDNFAWEDKFRILTARPWRTTPKDFAGLWLFFFRSYHRLRQGSRVTGIQGHSAVVDASSEAAGRVAIRVLIGSERDSCRQGEEGDSGYKFVHRTFPFHHEQTRTALARN
ncbi:conserved hypothetical protein [Mesorhizobium ventifaucium]|uniref:Uncharacterized protein n=1 Tax=Mesorhizobium ventifaucium TaxID=666020 RepID=A0ABN8JC39_9HYPH|nr:conserved hypothetical protein [Mesorhizobium ventifaucium]